MFITAIHQKVTCDFEEKYICGYYYDLHRLWSRIRPVEYQDPSVLIQTDRSGSTLGKIAYADSLYYYLIHDLIGVQEVSSI